MPFTLPYTFQYYSPGASGSAKALFLSSIPFDAATLITESEITTLPARYLQTISPEQKWRSPIYNPTLVVQFASARAFDSVVITAHNGISTSTVRVRGGHTQESVTSGTPTIDTGFVSMWPVSGMPTGDKLDGYPYMSSLVQFENEQTLEWASLSFDVSGGIPPETFEAGRIMIDRAVRIGVLTNSIGIQAVTTDEQRRGAFNRIRTDARGPIGRRMSLPFTAINKETLRDFALNFQMRHGRSKDFFFSANPTADKDFFLYSMQALFEDPSQFNRLLQFDGDGAVWRSDISIVEQL